MTEGLMPIGMFSRASLLSIKALRDYHRAGILVPARIDPSTGYRTYHVSQLTDADVLRRLRALDLPLCDVREILTARDPAVTRKVLAEHGQRLAERLVGITRSIEEVQAGLGHPAGHTPVHIRDEPAALTVEYPGAVPTTAGYGPFLDRAYPALYAVLARVGVPPAGPPGALYPAMLEEPAQVRAYLPISAAVVLPPDRGAVAIGELPPATFAVLTHYGGYDSVADTYQLLGRWVAEHATPGRDAPVREVYVIGPGDTEDAAGYRTDICWPLDHRPGEPGPVGGTT